MGLLDWFTGRATTAARLPERPVAPIARTAPPPAFAVVDVETTGLSPRSDRVLEVAVVRVDARGGVVDEWSTRLDPEGPVGATHIHGIRPEDVVGAPLFRQLAGHVASRFSGLPVVAHNARFDLAFLRAEFQRAGWDMPYLPAFCTLDASYHYLPDLDRRRLADCCWATGVRLDGAHSALGDARATAGLLQRYLGGIGGLPVHGDLVSLPGAARSVTWPTGPVREPVTILPGASPSARRPLHTTPPRPVPRPLVQRLTGLSLLELVDEGAPPGTLTYLEQLADALEDGDISDAEAGRLHDLVEVYALTREDLDAAHRAFVLALAHRALDDGHVSRAERTELHALAGVLEVPKSTVLDLIQRADRARSARMSADLRPLPDDWPFGDPVRVGDKVVFTGCDDAQRARLERRAEELGVRVQGNVSRLTAMLVTDGSSSGTKLARAAELGTRVVHPDDFEVLLAHLQPALEAASGARLRPPARAGRDVPRAAASPSAIRSWALANGYAVGVRGRLPRDVVDAFERARL